MSLLAALNRANDQLSRDGKVPVFGFSTEKIGFILSLRRDGTLACPPIDWRDGSGKKRRPRPMAVPEPPKRTSGIAPNFLWDKSAYVLGVTAGEGKRLAREHQAFIDFHTTLLQDSDDIGLRALLAFLHAWRADAFDAQPWTDDIKAAIKDENIVFALESERQDGVFLHDRPAARAIWARHISADEQGDGLCLVTGTRGPIARLHGSIKGVYGAQSSGAALVSFNLDAFTSYGHEQGANAPVSAAAAFGYATALNKYLEKGSANRLQLGDAATVFWAEAETPDLRTTAEAFFTLSMANEIDPAVEANNRVKPILDAMRQGQRLSQIRPDLAKGVRFYVLGLAPNAARLSVRFWLEDDFGDFADRYQKFLDEMRIEPPDRHDGIALWQYLREIAVLGKSENIPPNLAGEWIRAILAGTPYPLSLLSAVLIRIRADQTVNARRVSILKAVLIRNRSLTKEAPVAFDADNRNKGYLLGRLFAVYEHIQTAALGRLNASIKDKFYSAASAQPRKVFPLLDKGATNHLAKLGKQRPGQRVNLDKHLSEIMQAMTPGDDPFPAAFSSEEQALFALGYYHQREILFPK